MKKSKLGYLIIGFLICWFVAWLALLPAICCAERTYMITESELMTLAS